MKEYEIVHEIFNECANNQMRDVFFEEAEVEDPESYVRARHKDKELHLEKPCRQMDLLSLILSRQDCCRGTLLRRFNMKIN